MSSDHIRIEKKYEDLLEQSGEVVAQKELDRLVREILQSAIEGCTYGLLFTNRPWGDSPYCNQEVELLLNLIGKDDGRIIQVCLPDDRMPQHVEKMIEGLPTLTQPASDPDLDEVVEFVFSHFPGNWGMNGTMRFQKGQYIAISDGGAWVDFALGLNFSVELVNGQKWTGQIRPEQARTFSGVFGDVGITMSILFRPRQADLSPWQLAEGIQKPDRSVSDLGMQESLDDRRVNALLRQQASIRFANTHLQERGCHLFWHGNSGHLSMTYYDREGHRSGSWHRAYQLILEDPHTGRIGQLDVDFILPCEEIDEQEGFQQLLMISSALDELMGTFQYRGVRKHSIGLILLVALLLMTTSGVIGAFLLKPMSYPWSVVCGAIIGLLWTPKFVRRIR